MSRTMRKGTKAGTGYDYWKRRLRYSTSCGYGKGLKISTSRLHRRLARGTIGGGDYDAAEVLNARVRGMAASA